ncbi:hypothetical protein THER_1827 [Thermodesulfovibrio sp. N1]|jgi:hypothetical protein|nr:hypothetical protein THER_1827 [Thermodesulfovibrio sp. N1]
MILFSVTPSLRSGQALRRSRSLLLFCYSEVVNPPRNLIEKDEILHFANAKDYRGKAQDDGKRDSDIALTQARE